MRTAKALTTGRFTFNFWRAKIISLKTKKQRAEVKHFPV